MMDLTSIERRRSSTGEGWQALEFPDFPDAMSFNDSAEDDGCSSYDGAGSTSGSPMSGSKADQLRGDVLRLVLNRRYL